MISHMTVLAAATTAPAAPIPEWAQFIKSTGIFIPLLLVFVIMMTVMRNGKGKQDKERQLMLKQMKRGDRIQTIGGIMGTVMRTEESRIEVKVDEASNTKIWFTRSAIHRVVDADKAEAGK